MGGWQEVGKKEGKEKKRRWGRRIEGKVTEHLCHPLTGHLLGYKVSNLKRLARKLHKLIKGIKG